MNAQQLRDRSQRFALEITKFCETLPRDPLTQKTAGQLHDAAHSAAMNYRAACRARSHAEFVAKLCITVEEADEAQGWIDGLITGRKAAGDHVERLYRESTELVKIFTASKRTAMQRKRGGDTSRRR